MEDSRPRKAEEAIRYILVHQEAFDRHPERVTKVLANFPDVQPAFTPTLDQEVVAQHFQTAFPDAQHELVKNKTSTEVSAGKRFMVIGEIEPERGAEAFLDSKGMVCHAFHYIFVMVNGCVYNCQYCFLQEHIWDKDVSSYLRLNVNYEDIVERMREIALAKLAESEATRFQMGVLMDSLALESVIGFVEFLAPHLGEDVFARSSVELLTKGSDIQVLLDAAAKYPWATKRLLPGFSINSVYATDKYELGTARTHERLQAARQLQDAGYDLVFRIDPVVPYPGWRKDYLELVDTIWDEYKLRPANVVVASLRFDEQDLINTAKERFPNSDLFGYDFPKEDRAKYRIAFDRRIEIYRAIIDRIREHHPDQVIGVCKENMKTWQALDLRPSASCLSRPLLPNTINQFVLD
jgi:DNA repair photolyase